jgi:hypothetical protein
MRRLLNKPPEGNLPVPTQGALVGARCSWERDARAPSGRGPNLTVCTATAWFPIQLPTPPVLPDRLEVADFVRADGAF